MIRNITTCAEEINARAQVIWIFRLAIAATFLLGVIAGWQLAHIAARLP